MKLTKTASGKTTVKMSRSEWTEMGKKAGWLAKQDGWLNKEAGTIDELSQLLSNLQKSIGYLKEASPLIHEKATNETSKKWGYKIDAVVDRLDHISSQLYEAQQAIPRKESLSSKSLVKESGTYDDLRRVNSLVIQAIYYLGNSKTLASKGSSDLGKSTYDSISVMLEITQEVQRGIEEILSKEPQQPQQ